MARILAVLLTCLAAASAYFVAPRSFAPVAQRAVTRAQPVIMRLSKGDMKRRIKPNEAVWHASTKEALLTDEIATLMIKSNAKDIANMAWAFGTAR